MENKKTVSRRNFIRNTSLSLGAGLAAASMPSCNAGEGPDQKKLPGEIVVASVDLKGLWPDTSRESRIGKIMARMEQVAGIHPDIICLPELFDTIWVSENYKMSEVAENEKDPGPVTRRIAEFALKHNCYIVCPVYTRKDGHYYNSSLLIDRKGHIAGAYNKIHPVKSEILPQSITDDVGIRPGAKDQPLIETDFGKAGMQICYDANWFDGWDNCRKQGADIIFFSSAFPGGRILNYHALRCGCYIISSTGGDARIIDMSGNDLASSSTFIRYVWAGISFNKVCTSTWPTNQKLPDILKKYGSRLDITVWDNTSNITIASLDKSIKAEDVVKEFGLLTVDENIAASEEVQIKYRPKTN